MMESTLLVRVSSLSMMMMMRCRYHHGFLMNRSAGAALAWNPSTMTSWTSSQRIQQQSTLASGPLAMKKTATTTTTTTATKTTTTKKKKMTKAQKLAGGMHRDWLKKQKRKRGLHIAAQWKRILSKCDYWWSSANLPTDDFLKSTLRKHDGWCPICTLLTFRSFQQWVTSPRTIVDALTSSAAEAKWRVQERPDIDSGKPQWFVRRTNVTVATIDQWEQEREQQENENETTTAASRAAKKRRQLIKSLPAYSLPKDSKIILVQEPSQLASLCDKLYEAMQLDQQHSNKNMMTALDVEYATLEMDIRQTLPAMMQLAVPTRTNNSSSSSSSSSCMIIGLIWLHKFPLFGQTIMNPNIVPNPDHCMSLLNNTKRTTSITNSTQQGNDIMDNIITDPHFHAYDPLRQLLMDSSVTKVGLAIHQDVSNLLKWWGIQSKDQAYFVTNVMDLTEDDYYPNNTELLAGGMGTQDGPSLQDLCATILKKQLVKDKTMTNNKAGRKKRRKSKIMKKKIEKLSHWRAKKLTQAMTEYAAQDVAAVVDIYQTLQQQQQQQNNMNRNH
jgi:3'-5' exonuclease